MIAARVFSGAALPAARRAGAQSAQRRSNQIVPRGGTTVEEFQAEAINHIRARVRRQQEIKDAIHHSEAEEIEEMSKWIKISFFVAIPVCVLSFAKDFSPLVDHAHAKPGPMPDYMKVRTKEFPWECEDCALFDLDCWAKCRADRAAEAESS